MPLLPFRTSPPSTASDSRRARLAIAAGLVGILAALLAYAISPTVRHAVKHAAGSVRHAVARVFHDEDRRQAPALNAQMLSAGAHVQLSSLHGHRAVIVFWSDSCSACTTQAGAIARFAGSSYGHARTVAVDSGSDRAAAERFIELHRWRFPNLFDPTSQLAQRYGIKHPTSELPVAFVLDSSGGIMGTLRGPQSYSSLTRAITRSY
ncbi:MAG: TlpA family protein disulfide reductase [Solirubrobacteraceae bacterium]